VLNHTLIDKLTNISIGKRPPSAYLADMESEMGPTVKAVLESHGLPPAATGPLRTDDYPAFLSWRQAHLAQELGIVTLGLTGLDEEPESDPTDLIASGESSVVEFKSSARWNMYTHARDERLEQKIVETVAGFMNADGGTLLIGVDDEGIPVGLDEDLKLMNKPDTDRYHLWLTDLLTTELGTAAAASITIRFTKLAEDTDICVVRAPASPVPVFVHPPKSDAHDFYLRVQNSTRKLSTEDYEAYRSGRWGT
jgi:hypothetical protein